MSDAVLIALLIGVTVVISIVAVLALRHAGRRPDPTVALLARDPLLGKDYYAQFYATLPRQVVFELRTEFGRLAGVPADFLLPFDQLSKIGTADAKAALQTCIESLIAHKNLPTAEVAKRLSKCDSLDAYTAAAVELWQMRPQPRPERAGMDSAAGSV
jgi:hypothetical protein